MNHLFLLKLPRLPLGWCRYAKGREMARWWAGEGHFSRGDAGQRTDNLFEPIMNHLSVSSL
jgi:hypothetical protein